MDGKLRQIGEVKMSKVFEMSTFTDDGNCNREDVNQMISALVRMGYTVWKKEDYIVFNIGNDDIIKEKNE